MNNTKRFFITVLAIIVLILSIANTVKAITQQVIDETRKCSLTITKYEHSNGSKENIKLKGVEFTIYLLPNEIYQVSQAIEYVKSNEVTSFAKTTPENGTVKFENLEQGRYLVQETDAPKNVVTKIDSFLIELPRLNDSGDKWDYDVTVYPKNITVYGTVTLNQTTQDNEQLSGAVWELQQLNSNNEWKKYDYEGDLVTNENGQIYIQNLEVGQYRLIQNDTLEGYILDKTNIIKFNIDTKNIDHEFDVINEKLEIQKQVLEDNGKYGKSQGAFKKDTHSWKITTDIPDVINKMEIYKIKDELPEGLLYNTDSIKIFGINSNNEEVIISNDYYTQTIKSNMFEFDFDTKKLQQYDNIIVKYDTIFESKVSYGRFENKASLSYTDSILEDGRSNRIYTDSDEAEVHTGAVLIYKTDEFGNPLPGAIFKIAKSNEDASEGEYITDGNGEDLVVTSDNNGHVIFEGLKYDDSTSYWVVEIQAPSYEEDGEIKHYNLLKKPVKVIVDDTSQKYSEENTTVVVNKKSFVLPMAGGTIGIISSVLGLGIISIVIIIKKRNSN